MDIVFDFSFADQLGAFFYDLSEIDAVQYLLFVSECFSDVFLRAEVFYSRIGFLWMLLAAVFFVILSRTVFAPIIGGRAFNLGPDRARSRSKKVKKSEESEE